MEQINPLLNFWFPDDNYHIWWFKSTNELDQKIYNQYYQQMIDTFDNFDLDNYMESTPEQIIQNIILLDQFSRNINRIVGNINIIQYTNKAIELSNEWIKRKYYLTCPIKWTIFAFLPIRHSKTRLEELVGLLEQIEKSNNLVSNDKIYQKFKIHTNRQLTEQEHQY